ncbi:MAG: hypothetical protein RSE62_03100 [Citrobacter sp.]
MATVISLPLSTSLTFSTVNEKQIQSGNIAPASIYVESGTVKIEYSSSSDALFAADTAVWFPYDGADKVASYASRPAHKPRAWRFTAVVVPAAVNIVL